MILLCQYTVTQLSVICILVSFPGSNLSCKVFASQLLLPFPLLLSACSVLSLVALVAEDRCSQFVKFHLCWGICLARLLFSNTLVHADKRCETLQGVIVYSCYVLQRGGFG